MDDVLSTIGILNQNYFNPLVDQKQFTVKISAVWLKFPYIKTFTW